AHAEPRHSGAPAQAVGTCFGDRRRREQIRGGRGSVRRGAGGTARRLQETGGDHLDAHPGSSSQARADKIEGIHRRAKDKDRDPPVVVTACPQSSVFSPQGSFLSSVNGTNG